MMFGTRTTLTITALALLCGLTMLAGCAKRDEPIMAPASPLLPKTKAVAQVAGWNTLYLHRYFDPETGMLCYMLNDSESSPACTKVAEPTRPVDAY